MKLFVYTLQGCKTCIKRQSLHNTLHDYLRELGVEQIGVRYGMIDGSRYEPLEQHDQLCRKPEDPSKYLAPCYILECGDVILKLEDIGNFQGVDDYISYLNEMIFKATGKELLGEYDQ